MSNVYAPPEKKSNRFKRLFKAENLLLVAGLIALAYYGGIKLYISAFQAYERYAFEEQLNGRIPSIKGFAGNLLGRNPEPLKAAMPKPIDAEALLRSMIYAPEVVPTDKGWSADRLKAFREAANPPSGSVMGRLEIPSLDVSVMLLHGTDDKTLNRAVGHIEGTSLPGQPGNLGVAGHRDGFFRPLKDISKDTVITLTTLKGRFYYRVTKIHIVRPKDVHLLAPTRRPTMTMVTCYPFHYVGDAPKRYVVQAEIFKIQGPSEFASEHAAAR